MQDQSTEPHTLRWSWLIREIEYSARGMQHMLLLLAAHAGADNECDPAIPTLARRIQGRREHEHVSDRTVQTWLKAAEKAGLILRLIGEGRIGTNGRPTNKYRLTFPPLDVYGERREYVADGSTYRFDWPHWDRLNPSGDGETGDGEVDFSGRATVKHVGHGEAASLGVGGSNGASEGASLSSRTAEAPVAPQIDPVTSSSSEEVARQQYAAWHAENQRERARFEGQS